MQIVINIPESIIEHIKDGSFGARPDDKYLLAYAAMEGIRLPKGHGRLIDADALVSEIKNLKKSPWYKDNTNFSYLPRKEAVEIIEEIIIEAAPTIVGADKEAHDGTN